MIKINLIQGSNAANFSGPSAEVFEGELSPEQAKKQGSIRLLMLVLGPVALFVYETQFNMPELKAQFVKINKEYTALLAKNNKFAETVAVIKTLKAQQDKLKKQLDVIDGLRKDRMREVKIMDSLQREIPERAWLHKIDVKQGKLFIEGFAESSNEVNQLNEMLTRSAYLKSVRLESDAEETYQQGYVRKFSFAAQIEGVQ
jgi:Tfp pilus assembly protein PilN